MQTPAPKFRICNRTEIITNTIHFISVFWVMFILIERKTLLTRSHSRNHFFKQKLTKVTRVIKTFHIIYNLAYIHSFSRISTQKLRMNYATTLQIHMKLVFGTFFFTDSIQLVYILIMTMHKQPIAFFYGMINVCLKTFTPKIIIKRFLITTRDEIFWQNPFTVTKYPPLSEVGRSPGCK